MPKLAPHDLFIFMMQLGLLIGLAKLLGEAAKKMKQPAVIGEILAGIILGPTILGSIAPALFNGLFFAAPHATYALDGFVFLSVLFLLFVVGLEIDIDMIKKQGKAVGWISALGIIIPFLVGFGTGWLMHPMLGISLSQTVFAIFLGAALSVSALPVIARVLLDLNMLKTPVGNLIVAVATINDLVGWLLFTLALSLSGLGGEGNIWVTVLLTLVLVISTVTWFKKLLCWVMNKAQKAFGMGGIFVVALVAMLGASMLTEHIGIHAVFGAFMVGIALATSKEFVHEARESIHLMTSHLFAPLFFAAVGLKVNFLLSFDIRVVAIIIAVAYVSKLFAAWLGGKFAKISSAHAWAVGWGIAARGGMGIILAIIAYDAKLINEVLFEALVIMALVTSITSGRVKKVNVDSQFFDEKT